MSHETIKSLREALSFSPDNVPLRLHLAETLMQEALYAEAGVEYTEVLNRSYGNSKAKLGLAEAYFHQQKFSTAIIIYEEIQHQLPPAATILYVTCLIRER